VIPGRHVKMRTTGYRAITVKEERQGIELTKIRLGMAGIDRLEGGYREKLMISVADLNIANLLVIVPLNFLLGYYCGVAYDHRSDEEVQTPALMLE
jgi:hypothetical protein